jgi:hypothetical protein
MSSRLRKRKVDWVVEDQYWAGFFACLGGRENTTGFGYASTSGLYYYNGVGAIAYRHGVQDCLKILHDRSTPPVFLPGKPDIPGYVYTEAYGAAQIAMRKSKP